MISWLIKVGKIAVNIYLKIYINRWIFYDMTTRFSVKNADHTQDPVVDEQLNHVN